ncbi:MAG: hypothetical protein ACRC8S_19280 [Fimbriiglobus sp.]
MYLILFALVFEPDVRIPAPDPARSFPKGTLAYAEIRDGERLRESLNSLLRDTPWADSLKAAHKSKKPLHEVTQMLATMVAPEMLRDVGRCSAGVGFLGFNAKHQPRYGGIVHFNRSILIPLAVRKALLDTTQVHEMTKLGEVSVYQLRTNLDFHPEAEDQPPPAEKAPKPWPIGENELTIAFTEDKLVFGSDLDAIKMMLAPLPENQAETLAGNQAFANSRQSWPSPVKVFVRPRELLADATRAAKAGGQFHVPAWMQLLLRLQDVPEMHGSLLVASDRLGWQLDFPNLPERHPLRAIVSGSNLSGDHLKTLKNAENHFAWSLPATDRAKWLATTFDALAKSAGQLGELPSESLAKTVDPKLLERIDSVSISGFPARPQCTLHFKSDETTRTWGAVLPKVLKAFAPEAGAISSEATATGRLFKVREGGVAWEVTLNPTSIEIAQVTGPLLKPVAFEGTPDAPLFGQFSWAPWFPEFAAIPNEVPVPIRPRAVPIPAQAIPAINGLNDGLIVLDDQPDENPDTGLLPMQFSHWLHTLPPMTLRGQDSKSPRFTLTWDNPKAALKTAFETKATFRVPTWRDR